jgi:hypothetical protein
LLQRQRFFASLRTSGLSDLRFDNNLLRQHQWRKFLFIMSEMLMEMLTSIHLIQMQICAGEIDFTGPVTININNYNL